MVKVQHFTAKSFEKNLAELGKYIEKSQEAAGLENQAEKELVKESLKSLAETLPQPSSSSAPAAPIANPVAVKDDGEFLPQYLQTSNNPQVKAQIQRMVKIAFHKDIKTALKLSRRFPGFVEDAVHDALADKIIPELKKRGLLK